MQGDDSITARVEAIFATDELPEPAMLSQLPPRDHLLNWALELQDENLMRLANPQQLPVHPLRQDDRLLWLLLQEQARCYEQMLMVLNQRQLQQDFDHRVAQPLHAALPDPDLAGISQGHYRIGATEDPAAYDNELPPQIVQLSSFRIDRRPVANAAFLGFIEAGGYQQTSHWDEAGSEWLQRAAGHPDHWRQDSQGNWYGIGINGPFDLQADEPVMGICQHEACAYANWLSTGSEALAGAALQHEYQWEVAARTRSISGYGQVWEWCANRFEPYTDYRQPPREQGPVSDFNQHEFCLRGASLHTQQSLKRPYYRHHALAEARHLFCGTRLIFPPLG